MKLDVLETHDRLQHLVKDQSEIIFQGAEECLKRNPTSLAMQDRSPYIYIFAHPRKSDDGINTRLLWQPRLSIPKAQTNSYLFRAISKTDQIQIVWMIPPREMWGQYDEGNVTESNICAWSINQFKFNREALERPHPDDMSETKGMFVLQAVYDEIKHQAKKSKLVISDSSLKT